MARCLVTGGGGFIGSNLVDALLEAGYEVRILDNFATGDRRNLLHLSKDVEIVEGDLRSFERAAAAARDCELVFHQAALPSVPRSVADPLTTNGVNVTGTLNVLLAARDAGARRLVYASSSSVYGANPAAVKSEDLPIGPISPYGTSKYTGESYCRSFYEVYGLETVALRYFNVFGPRQNPLSEYAAVIPNFFSAALLGERPTVHGDGLQTRDFTYIANVVDANIRAATAEGAEGQAFNVACGETHSLLDILSEISDISGTPLDPVHTPPRTGDVRASLADVSKARRVLGYEVKVGLREGLERTYEHFTSDSSLVPRIQEKRQWLALAS